MSWLIEFVKALPIVAVTAVVVFLIPAFTGINGSKATGLAAVLGMAAPKLICIGVLNVALGLILWRLVVVWVR